MPSETVPVRLAGGEQETARKHRPGERHDDEIARGEVVRAADDAARATLLVRLAGARVVRADIDATPPDRLAVLLGLVDVAQHAADGQRAADLSRRLDALDLEPGPDQRVADIAACDVARQRDVLAYP